MKPSALRLIGSIRRVTSIFLLMLLASFVASAAKASDPSEEIVSVKTQSGHVQAGVFSRSGAASQPQKLLVVISGHPGVTRPFVNAAGRIQTKQEGNFLVRSKRFLLSDDVATLLLDCRSDFDTVCPDDYQASLDRAEDIQLLINHVRTKAASIREVWAVSTSRGVITTAGLAKHVPTRYAGLVHTAGTYGKAIDQGLKFERTEVPQYFVHHRDDPCQMTLHEHAQAVSSKNGHQLVTVMGGSGFRGQACQAYTQHGFTGQEQKVAQAIRTLVETGRTASNLIE